MSSFERDNLSFHLEEYGSGVPFILSHGLEGNATLARDLIGTIGNVRVVVYDNRAHGQTSGNVAPGTLTFRTMAGDMAAVLDFLDIESAVIGGESMGAGISLAFWKLHPERVRALVLIRPAWLNTPYPPNLAILGTMGKLIDDFGREDAPNRFAQSPDFQQLAASYPETAKSLMRTLIDFTNPNLALAYKTIPASVPFGGFEELKAIDVPTLVIANRLDPLHPWECAERLAAAIPGAMLEEIPSKNEDLREHQQALRSVVSRFIAGVAAGRSVSHT